jgi:uncharacterized repeat protein (TIGR02543 family)
MNIGGLVGATMMGTIQNSYNTGSVTGQMNIGGLVGVNDGDTIQNSYNTGSVTGQMKIGGLVGVNDGGTITDSVNLSKSVTGTENVGRIVGTNTDGGTLENNYGYFGTSSNLDTFLPFIGDSGTAQNGKDASSTDFANPDFWQKSVGLSSNVWTFSQGNLPTLKGINAPQNPTYYSTVQKSFTGTNTDKISINPTPNKQYKTNVDLFTHSDTKTYTLSEGYKFSNIIINNTSQSDTRIITLNSNTDYNISAEIAPITEKVPVNFYSETDKEPYYKTTTDYNTLVKSPTDKPIKTGYTFKYWTTNTDISIPFDFDNTLITTNTDLYAKWQANTTSYTVTFNSNGGRDVSSQTVNDGERATKPNPDPTKSGYTFKYWYQTNENTPFDFENTPIVSDITLYAAWKINPSPPSPPSPPKPKPSPKPAAKVTKLYAPVTHFSVIKNKKIKFKYVVFYKNKTVKEETKEIKYKKTGKKKLTISKDGKKLTLVIKIVKKKLKPTKVKVKFTKSGKYYLANITYKNYPYYIAPTFEKQKGSKYSKYGLYSKKGTVTVKYWKKTYKVKIK